MNKTTIMKKDLWSYSMEHSAKVDDVLLELERETHIKELVPQMISGSFQGKLLQLISSMIRPKNILEIGTFTGFSAICLTAGLQEGGLVHTIEVNEEVETIANKYFKKAEVADQVKMYIGNALEIIPTIKETFDLVFIDAKKTDYAKYYELIFDKVPVGGFILTDNVLWDGKILKEQKDKKTQAIDDYNKMINDDLRVDNLLLPFNDGITIARKLNG